MTKPQPATLDAIVKPAPLLDSDTKPPFPTRRGIVGKVLIAVALLALLTPPFLSTRSSRSSPS